MECLQYHFSPDGGIDKLCDEIVNEEYPGVWEKIEATELSDDVGVLTAGYLNAGFAIGFAVGQIFETKDPYILEEVESIKKRLKEGKTLPYLPREKKAA